MITPGNIDATEVAKFDRLAHRWWDNDGAFRPLHDINPLRVRYIDERISLAGKHVLDVGCGGGILAEEMARHGAEVTGIDAAGSVIEVARAHQLGSKVRVTYECCTAEQHLAQHCDYYDVVTCLELLEHVPDPASLVHACAELARSGGAVFFSTINRNFKSWLNAIVGAEYVLGLLPRGTHDYEKFIKPSELARWARSAALELKELSGMRYNPVTRSARLSDALDVNYLAWMVRP